MSLYRSPQHGFEQRLRQVAAVVDLPADLAALRDRAKAFNRAPGTPMLDRLTRALIDGDTKADLDLIWACALAEIAGAGAHNDTREAIRAAMNRELRDRYAPHAISIYQSVAALFDAAATKLTASAAAVDIEAHPEAVLGARDTARRAYLDAPALAAELTRLLPALKSAAVLAEVCDDNADHDLALAVDPAELPRRDVWTAWDTEATEAAAERRAAGGSPFTTTPVTRSRCGRWGALLAAGCTLRACPPEAFTAYHRPGPMVEVVENTAGGPQRRLVDADHYQPPERRRITSPRVRVT